MENGKERPTSGQPVELTLPGGPWDHQRDIRSCHSLRSTQSLPVSLEETPSIFPGPSRPSVGCPFPPFLLIDRLSAFILFQPGRILSVPRLFLFQVLPLLVPLPGAFFFQTT